MTEFVALIAKAYAYLIEDGSEHKKAKRTKKGVMKGELILKNCKHSLFNNETLLNHNKYLKVIIIKCTRKKSINLH